MEDLSPKSHLSLHDQVSECQDKPAPGTHVHAPELENVQVMLEDRVFLLWGIRVCFMSSLGPGPPGKCFVHSPVAGDCYAKFLGSCAAGDVGKLRLSKAQCRP